MDLLKAEENTHFWSKATIYLRRLEEALEDAGFRVTDLDDNGESGYHSPSKVLFWIRANKLTIMANERIVNGKKTWVYETKGGGRIGDALEVNSDPGPIVEAVRNAKNPQSK